MPLERIGAHRRQGIIRELKVRMKERLDEFERALDASARRVHDAHLRSEPADSDDVDAMYLERHGMTHGGVSALQRWQMRHADRDE